MITATVITDASYCPKTGAAGWACWIACDSKRSSQRYGRFNNALSSSSEAELKAVINALHFAKEYGALSVLVITDCKEVYESKADDYRKLLSDWIDKLDIAVTFRHVKAHGEVKDAKTYCNAWCDKFARKAMQEMRKDIENGKVEQRDM